MKKIILSSAILLSTLLLGACGQKQNGPQYTGYWQGESNMIFQVLSEDNQNFTIRNVNGDLSAAIEDGKLCGKNTLNMSYCMTVQGDSAYYEFGGIKTGYKRIDQQTYESIFSTQKKASVTVPAGE